MAYGAQASLEHALPRIERASEMVAKILETERLKYPNITTLENQVLRDLVGAVACLYDAVMYLKEGVE